MWGDWKTQFKKVRNASNKIPMGWGFSYYGTTNLTIIGFYAMHDLARFNKYFKISQRKIQYDAIVKFYTIINSLVVEFGLEFPEEVNSPSLRGEFNYEGNSPKFYY